MNRPLRWYEYISINAYWFALSVRNNVLAPLLLPLLVQGFVGDAEKGAYMGTLRLWALMTAVLAQAFMGLLSDHSRFKWGKRRPFILIGTIGELLVFVSIGLISGLQGMTGFWTLFVIYIISMLFSNTAQAATQGLIPDLVPEEKKGRASGIKALLELPLPVIFVSLVISKMIAAGQVWQAIVTMIAVTILMLVITLTSPEKSASDNAKKLEFQPFLRLFGMTALFTAVILLSGALVKLVIGLAGEAGAILAGIIGLAGILTAIGVGVWYSVQVATGIKSSNQRNFVMWVINRLTFLAGSTGISTFILFFIQERFVEYSGTKAAAPTANLLMFVGIFILLAAIPSGWLTDRFGKRNIIIFSSLLAFAGTVVALAFNSLTTLTVGGSLLGAGIGLFYAANWALGTTLVSREKAGEMLGISNLAGAGAGAIGAFIGGPIGDQAGYTVLLGIYGALFIFAIVTALTINDRAPVKN